MALIYIIFECYYYLIENNSEEKNWKNPLFFAYLTPKQNRKGYFTSWHRKLCDFLPCTHIYVKKEYKVSDITWPLKEQKLKLCDLTSFNPFSIHTAAPWEMHHGRLILKGNLATLGQVTWSVKHKLQLFGFWFFFFPFLTLPFAYSKPLIQEWPTFSHSNQMHFWTLILALTCGSAGNAMHLRLASVRFPFE